MPPILTPHVIEDNTVVYYEPPVCEPAAVGRLYQVPPGDVVLVGTLCVQSKAGYGGEPHLYLDAWCPFCRREHTTRWLTPPSRPDEVRFVRHYKEIDPDCPLRKLAPRGYYVGLDPNQEPEHNRRIAEFEAEMADWVTAIQNDPEARAAARDALETSGPLSWYAPDLHDELAMEGDEGFQALVALIQDVVADATAAQEDDKCPSRNCN